MGKASLNNLYIPNLRIQIGLLYLEDETVRTHSECIPPCLDVPAQVQPCRNIFQRFRHVRNVAGTHLDAM